MSEPLPRAEEVATDIVPDPWKSRTTETLTDAVVAMRIHGMEDGLIRSVLNDVVGAIRSEYGE